MTVILTVRFVEIEARKKVISITCCIINEARWLPVVSLDFEGAEENDENCEVHVHRTITFATFELEMQKFCKRTHSTTRNCSNVIELLVHVFDRNFALVHDTTY